MRICSILPEVINLHEPSERESDTAEFNLILVFLAVEKLFRYKSLGTKPRISILDELLPPAR